MQIVIIGGGTAGWLSALFLTKMCPQHNITVIESSKIGIIGPGEGATGLITSVATNEIFDFGCNIFDFFKETKSSIKYAIRHEGWGKNVNEYYIAPIDGSPTSGNPIDLFVAHNIACGKLEDIHKCTELGILLEHEKSLFDTTTLNFVGNFGMHFDGRLVGQYFKKIAMLSTNIRLVDAVINDVCLDERGYVDNLVLDSGDKIDGNFFIDASGFRRIIPTKMGIKWISYKSNLPVNTAVPFFLDNDDKFPPPYTLAKAMKSGWMWQATLQHRKGCGYVFSDSFITPEQAVEEIETTLGRKIDPIKTFRFDAGRLEKMWSKNCLALGLCSAFAEPLEATSLHATILQMRAFLQEFLKDDYEHEIPNPVIDNYNKRFGRMYDEFKDFLVMHYMGGRDDSEFWRSVGTGSIATDKVRSLIELAKHKIPNRDDIPETIGCAGWGLWSYIMAGLRLIPKEVARSTLEQVRFDPCIDLKVHTQRLMNDFSHQIFARHRSNLDLENFYRHITK